MPWKPTRDIFLGIFHELSTVCPHPCYATDANRFIVFKFQFNNLFSRNENELKHFFMAIVIAQPSTVSWLTLLSCLLLVGCYAMIVSAWWL